MAKITKTPILLDGGKDGVVVVRGAVNVVSLGSDASADENRPYLVVAGRALALVPSKQNGSSLVKGSVAQQRLNEALGPSRSGRQASVVTIIVHVGSSERIMVSFIVCLLLTCVTTTHV